MILGRPRKSLLALFPVIGLVLFSVMRYAGCLHLANVDLIWTYDLAQGTNASVGMKILAACRFLSLVLGISFLMCRSSSCSEGSSENA
jgi:hypothetical protein